MMPSEVEAKRLLLDALRSGPKDHAELAQATGLIFDDADRLRARRTHTGLKGVAWHVTLLRADGHDIRCIPGDPGSTYELRSEAG